MDLQIWPPPPPGSAGSSHLGLHQHPLPKEDIGVEARHAEHLISRLTAHQQTLPDLLVLHHPRHIHHAIFDGPPMYGHSPGGKARNHGTGIPLEKNGVMYTISLPWVWATPRIRKVIIDTIDGFQD